MGGRERWARVFGERVRAARQARRLTQEGLGHESGFDRTVIGRLERGDANPTLRTIVHVADTLGVDPGELVKGLEPD